MHLYSAEILMHYIYIVAPEVLRTRCFGESKGDQRQPVIFSNSPLEINSKINLNKKHNLLYQNRICKSNMEAIIVVKQIQKICSRANNCNATVQFSHTRATKSKIQTPLYHCTRHKNNATVKNRQQTTVIRIAKKSATNLSQIGIKKTIMSP